MAAGDWQKGLCAKCSWGSSYQNRRVFDSFKIYYISLDRISQIVAACTDSILRRKMVRICELGPKKTAGQLQAWSERCPYTSSWLLETPARTKTLRRCRATKRPTYWAYSQRNTRKAITYTTTVHSPTRPICGAIPARLLPSVAINRIPSITGVSGKNPVMCCSHSGMI